jgi:hypothetical protein
MSAQISSKLCTMIELSFSLLHSPSLSHQNLQPPPSKDSNAFSLTHTHTHTHTQAQTPQAL